MAYNVLMCRSETTHTHTRGQSNNERRDCNLLTVGGIRLMLLLSANASRSQRPLHKHTPLENWHERSLVSKWRWRRQTFSDILPFTASGWQNDALINIAEIGHTKILHSSLMWWQRAAKAECLEGKVERCELVSWSLTSPFSTNMAISDTKGQGQRAIPTRWRKASDILPKPCLPFCSAATQKG